MQMVIAYVVRQHSDALTAAETATDEGEEGEEGDDEGLQVGTVSSAL